MNKTAVHLGGRAAVVVLFDFSCRTSAGPSKADYPGSFNMLPGFGDVWRQSGYNYGQPRLFSWHRSG